MLETLEPVFDRIDEWTLMVALALIGLEILNDLIRRRSPGRRLLDGLASLSTQIPASSQSSASSRPPSSSTTRPMST